MPTVSSMRRYGGFHGSQNDSLATSLRPRTRSSSKRRVSRDPAPEHRQRDERQEPDEVEGAPLERAVLHAELQQDADDDDAERRARQQGAEGPCPGAGPGTPRRSW